MNGGLDWRLVTGMRDEVDSVKKLGRRLSGIERLVEN